MIDKVPVVIVVAMSRKRRALGKDGKLLWHISEDLKRFKEMTLEKPVVMGRKTFESIVDIIGKPLPNRPNIVVTRNEDYHYDGIEVVNSLEEGLYAARLHNPSEIHIGGGADLYEQALPYTDKLFITFVDNEPDADIFFPEFEHDFRPVKEYPIVPYEDFSYQWIDFERK